MLYALLCRCICSVPWLPARPATPLSACICPLPSCTLQLHTLRDGRRVRTLRALGEEIWGKRGRRWIVTLQIIDMVTAPTTGGAHQHIKAMGSLPEGRGGGGCALSAPHGLKRAFHLCCCAGRRSTYLHRRWRHLPYEYYQQLCWS